MVSLEGSGWGCYVGNYFYGATAYADDILLLSPSRHGLQQMFDICHKTKCIFFPHGAKGNDPIKIMMGDTPLPWVDSWPHLGNDLFCVDFAYPLKCSFKHDLLKKRGRFIGKFHELWQDLQIHLLY